MRSGLSSLLYLLLSLENNYLELAAEACFGYSYLFQVGPVYIEYRLLIEKLGLCSYNWDIKESTLFKYDSTTFLSIS